MTLTRRAPNVVYLAASRPFKGTNDRVAVRLVRVAVLTGSLGIQYNLAVDDRQY
jgi:hypothetical protein